MSPASGPTQPLVEVSSSDLDEFGREIDTAFGWNSTYGEPCAACDQGDTKGAIVRMVFHDAVGGGGRTNGCVDFSTPDNNGLQDMDATLRAIWQTSAPTGLSYADTIVFAGGRAILHATTRGQNAITGGGVLEPETMSTFLDLNALFSYGRLDAPCPAGVDAGQFPSAVFSWADSVQFFAQKFGMGTADVVAIFGAHSLGRADGSIQGSSGAIVGGWTGTQSSLSNVYYKTMEGVNWATNNNETWNGGANGAPTGTILLQSDLEVLVTPARGCKRFGAGAPINPAPGSLCPVNAAASAFIRSFSQEPGGTAAFWEAFSVAWVKMVTAGHTQLAEPV